VILQPPPKSEPIGVYRVNGGRLAEPFFLRFAEIASQPPRRAYLSRAIRSQSATTNGDLGDTSG